MGRLVILLIIPFVPFFPTVFIIRIGSIVSIPIRRRVSITITIRRRDTSSRIWCTLPNLILSRRNVLGLLPTIVVLSSPVSIVPAIVRIPSSLLLRISLTNDSLLLHHSLLRNGLATTWFTFNVLIFSLES